MSTKPIIGAIVGGIIVFLWQFLSWVPLNIHGTSQQYTANQDSILKTLQSQLASDGTYFLPSVPPGTSAEDAQKSYDANDGKPWAIVSYRKSMNTNMSMNMVRGLIVDIVAVMLLIWLLAKIPDINMSTTVLSCIVVGLVGYFTSEYANSIWFEYNTIPDLIDAIVSWGLCGLWLGFWIPRK